MPKSALPTLAEVGPIAVRLRDREEEIAAKKTVFLNTLGDLMALGVEQGRDLVLAQTKIKGSPLSFRDWLKSQAPNIAEAQAHKYVRLGSEQIRSPRDAAFAFLPMPPRRPAPKRAKPAAWETAWGTAGKLSKALREKMPAAQRELLREELARLQAQLGEGS